MRTTLLTHIFLLLAIDGASASDPEKPSSRIVATLGTARLDAPSEVQRVAVSPDGRYIASLSETVFADPREQMCLFDATTGRKLHSLPGTGSGRWRGVFRFTADSKRLIGDCREWTIPDATSIARDRLEFWFAATADGRWAITRGADRQRVQLWDSKNDLVVSEMHIPVKTNGIQTAAIAAGGKIAALGTYDGQLQLWDAQSGKKLHDLKLPLDKYVTSLDFSPDGKQLAAGGYFPGIPIYDVSTGKLANTLKGHKRSPQVVRFSPSGKRIATGGRDDGVRIWDTTSGREEHTIRALSEVKSLAFTPDGKRFVVGCNDRTGRALRVFDIESGKEQLLDPGPRSNILQLVYSPEGHFLAARTAARNKVFLWDSVKGYLISELAGDASGKLRFSPDGWILATVGRYGSYEMWEPDTTDLVIKRVRPIAPAIGANDVSRQLDRLAVAGIHGKVIVSDMASGEVQISFTPDETNRREVKALAFSPDGKRLAMPTHDPRTPGVSIFDVTTGKFVRKLTTKILKDRFSRFGFSNVLFSGDGSRLLALSDPGTLHSWDLITGAEFARIAIGRRGVFALSEDGKYLARINGKACEFLEMATQQTCMRHDLGIDAVTALAISPDGKTIAAALQNSHVIQLWSTAPEKFSPSVAFDEATITASWDKLRIPKGTEGYLAMWQLVDAGDEAVAWIDKRLVADNLKVNAAKLKQWIEDLDDDKFVIRQAATENLLLHGVEALPQLQKSLKGDDVSPEVKLRISHIVKALESPVQRTGGEPLRGIRAVDILERINTKKARLLVERLSKGPDASRVVLDARTALTRMKARARGR